MDTGYVIVSDATSDLPLEISEKYDIRILPMSIRLGEKDYRVTPDESELSCKEFYTRLREGEYSATSQINPLLYRDFFEAILNEGKDIIYIGLSSGLSGTCNNACMMAEELMEEYPQRKIVCIDSLCASIGLGLLVFTAAKLHASGKSFEELCTWIQENKTKVCHWFSVDDLNHLKRGGRLNSLEALVGTALKIKPILSVNPEGKLVVVAKVRGIKKAMEYLRERLNGDGRELDKQTLIVGHTDAYEEAEELKSQILAEGIAKDVFISEIRPIIGTHVGSGMLALTFWGQNYNF